jgi:hypothetical protein
VKRPATEDELNNLGQLTSHYDPSDTYNMDKTALFFKAMPERTLATSAMPGVKIEKA